MLNPCWHVNLTNTLSSCKLIYNLSSEWLIDYTLYILCLMPDLSAIFHLGTRRFHPGTGPGGPMCSVNMAWYLVTVCTKMLMVWFLYRWRHEIRLHTSIVSSYFAKIWRLRSPGNLRATISKTCSRWSWLWREISSMCQERRVRRFDQTTNSP